MSGLEDLTLAAGGHQARPYERVTGPSSRGRVYPRPQTVLWQIFEINISSKVLR